LTVAKLKLSDFLQDHRRLAVNKGQSVNGEVIIEMFKKEIEDDHNNKPRTKLYKQEVLTALKKSWPELYTTDIAKINQKGCNEWAARYGKEYRRSAACPLERCRFRERIAPCPHY
jgi:hypothetical protein